MNPADATRWGAVAAELDDAFADAEAVLARQRLTPSEWRALHRELARATAADGVLREAFLRGYRLAKRAKAPPPIEAPAADLPAPAAPPVEVAQPAPRPASSGPVPTYLRPSRLLQRGADPPAPTNTRPTQALPSAFETEELPPRLASPAMPFAAGRPASPAAPATKDEVSSPSTGTLALPEGMDFDESLPFNEGGIRLEDVDLSMFPLERYAEVTSALAAGEERKSVLRRHVLTEVMWKALATSWANRIESDPALRARFVELVNAKRGRSS